MQADLAHSFSEMKLKMRGREEVEYEMVACVNRGKVKWDGLRVAGLCIGIDEYTNLAPLHNAVRDAEAVNGALKSVPGCYSAIIRDPKTATALLESVERHAKEPGLHDDPPDFFEMYYAGHAIQNEKDEVYLVPSEAKVDNSRYITRECVPLSEVLLILHDFLDEPVSKKSQKVIHFIIHLDSCRSSTHRDVNATLACEPESGKCPRKWSVIFSCSRTKPASDGPSGGHSPFAKAFLDPQLGFMAEGVSIHSAHFNIGNLLLSSTQNQQMKIIGSLLPAEVCVRPKVIAPDAPLEPSPSGKRRREGDDEFRVLLHKHGLDDIQQQLEENDLKSMRELEALARMPAVSRNKVIKDLHLSVLKAECVKELLKEVAQQKKQKGSGESSALGGSAGSMVDDDDADELKPWMSKTEEQKRKKEEAKFERSIESLKSQKNLAAIVSGMKLHAMHAGIQKKACRAFQDLAEDADDKIRIGKEGGIGRILAALDNHAHHAGVVKRACGALLNIGSSDAALRRSMKDGGAERLVRACLGRSDATDSTNKVGQMLLDMLADTKSWGQKLLDKLGTW